MYSDLEIRGASDWRDLITPDVLVLARKVVARMARRSGWIDGVFVGDEYESEAYVALCDLAMSYKDDSGVTFSSYVSRTLPLRLVDVARKLSFTPRLTATRARRDDVADMLPKLFRLEDVVGIGTVNDKVLERGHGVEDPDWEADFDAVSVREEFERTIRGLTPMERAVVRDYYIEGLTLAAIAREVGRSESAVCVIHKGAIKQLYTIIVNRRQVPRACRRPVPKTPRKSRAGRYRKRTG